MVPPIDLEKERRVLASGVRRVFTPNQPIMDTKLFFGRSTEVESIIQQLNTPGQHSVLFGERGVGKSSLANIACEILKGLVGGNLLQKRCDAGDTFQTIVELLLYEVGVDPQISSSQMSSREGGSTGLKGLISADGHETEAVNYSGVESRTVSPSWVARKIKGLRALFLLDEIDVIATEEKWKIAELVKQLSDEGSELKFLIVGIAETANELTHGHPSVQRCLKETQLNRMSDSEIEDIISSGESKVSPTFSSAAKRKIVRVSSGYPHFAHLLALKAAEEAIGEERADISLGHIQDATNLAVGDAEGTLKTRYQEAIRSSNTEEFKKILVAASVIEAEEFSAADLRDSYQGLWSVEINQGWLNNYLQRIVADDDQAILRRLAKGVYKFNDPRMPCFIKLANLSLVPDTEEE